MIKAHEQSNPIKIVYYILYKYVISFSIFFFWGYCKTKKQTDPDPSSPEFLSDEAEN